MKGLICKELLNMATYKRVFVGLFMAFMFLSFQGDYMPILSVTFITVATVFAITSFSYDMFTNWDAYVMTLPVTRKEIVRSKYLWALILMFSSSALVFIANLIVGLVRGLPFATMRVWFITIGLTMLVSALLITLLLPLIIEFGVEKGIMVMILTGVLGGAIYFPLSKLNIDLTWLIDIKKLLELFKGVTIKTSIVAAILLAIILLWCSYRISYKIYSKKEF
ncbi:MAG: ABC-2 transporter permease [Clostridia bacterium]|nr:ABC-2 transporter permease [Clostridia bacterium]